jgi:hypothetical protein
MEDGAALPIDPELDAKLDAVGDEPAKSPSMLFFFCGGGCIDAG